MASRESRDPGQAKPGDRLIALGRQSVTAKPVDSGFHPGAAASRSAKREASHDVGAWPPENSRHFGQFRRFQADGERPQRSVLQPDGCPSIVRAWDGCWPPLGEPAQGRGSMVPSSSIRPVAGTCTAARPERLLTRRRAFGSSSQSSASARQVGALRRLSAMVRSWVPAPEPGWV